MIKINCILLRIFKIHKVVSRKTEHQNKQKINKNIEIKKSWLSYLELIYYINCFRSLDLIAKINIDSVIK